MDVNKIIKELFGYQKNFPFAELYPISIHTYGTPCIIALHNFVIKIISKGSQFYLTDQECPILFFKFSYTREGIVGEIL